MMEANYRTATSPFEGKSINMKKPQKSLRLLEFNLFFIRLSEQPMPQISQASSHRQWLSAHERGQ